MKKKIKMIEKVIRLSNKDQAETYERGIRTSLIEELKKEVEGLKDKEHEEGSFKSDWILEEVLQILNNKK